MWLWLSFWTVQLYISIITESLITQYCFVHYHICFFLRMLFTYCLTWECKLSEGRDLSLLFTSTTPASRIGPCIQCALNKYLWNNWVAPSLECTLHEERDWVCIIHCSIPSTDHRGFPPIIFKALPALGSVYLLISFPFVVLECLSSCNSSSSFSSPDFCMFSSLTWLAPIHPLSSMWGQHYYLYVLVVCLPENGKLKCHCWLIYIKLQ